MKNKDILQIRKAQYDDLDTILEIYAYARSFMKEHNNLSQWGESHPPKNMLEDDILKERLYVVTSNNVIHAVFAFIIGEDPTYIDIEEGKWEDNSLYGTLHRIASDGKKQGIFSFVTRYCYSLIPHLRIDTHKDNLIMQHLILKEGFSYRGIIKVADGTPRFAYEKN